MTRKEEFQKFIGNSLPKEQIDLAFEVWSTMKDALGRKNERRTIPRFKQRVERKTRTARRNEIIKDLFERLERQQSRKLREHFSKENRKKYVSLMKEMSNEH